VTVLLDKELMEAEYAKFQPVTTRPSDTQQDADEVEWSC
jgi:hypothetical protein